MMGFIEDTLDEFDGQLSYSEILHMTQKEIIMLRKHRQERKRAKAGKPDANEQMKLLSHLMGGK